MFRYSTVILFGGLVSGLVMGDVTRAVAAPVAKQSVVSNGTKVASATSDATVSGSCKEKFNGCMDLMCMDDNVSGGRCLCNNRIFELEKIAADITGVKVQTVQLQTFGADAVKNSDAPVVEKKSGLDLSLWDTSTYEDEEVEEDGEVIEMSRGAQLLGEAAAVCAEKMPECADEFSVMTAMYDASTRSDCAAYENALKKQKTDAGNKLATAQSAMRTAALEKFQESNKYDLGQCTIAFTECMQTTAECGTDFTKCTSIVAMDSVGTRSIGGAGVYTIGGTESGIDISMTTYEVLSAKRPICDRVLESCAMVADNVWDAFLRANAPQIKNAELIAENTVRQECIGRISDCFVAGCKDNIDPKDPDGSYDMCLTRPETMMAICTVQLNSCGVDTSDVELAVASPIWNFVVDRLASMRVDSCTKQVKECLTGEGNCGENYANCVGLDTDTIVRMCPYDKLVGCQEKYRDIDIHGDDVYEELATMVRGLMVNIDNEMLTHCQKALDESMLRVCGATDNCDAMIFGENSELGAGSLGYGICEFEVREDGSIFVSDQNCRGDVSMISDGDLGYGGATPVPLAGMLSGQISWGMIEVDDKGRITDAEKYLESVQDNESKMSESQAFRISEELKALQRNIDVAISAIESDDTVQYCMTGRQIPGAKVFEGQTPRFPELTKSVRKNVAAHALKTAADNHGKRYDVLSEQMLKDYAILAGRYAGAEGKNADKVRREMARKSCVALAPMSVVPRSAEPPKNFWGTLVVAVSIVAAAVVMAVYCQPCLVAFAVGMKVVSESAIAAGASIAAISAAGGAVIGSGVAAVAASAVAIGQAASGKANDIPDFYTDAELKGTYEMSQWNYRETVDTEFNPQTNVCQKCVTKQNCSYPRNPMFGKKNCKKWSEKKTTCSDIQF